MTAFKQKFQLLLDPKKGLEEESKKTFEKALNEYLLHLVLLGVGVGVFIFLFNLAKSVYYDIIGASINYLYMLNFLLGNVTSVVFFYYFSGIFLLFGLSLVLSPFLKNMKLTKVLHLLFVALTPVLLFGFIPVLVPALFVWAVVLFIAGKPYFVKKKHGKDSIHQRT